MCVKYIYIYIYINVVSGLKSRLLQLVSEFLVWILRIINNCVVVINFRMMRDTTKILMSSPKCRSVEVINNLARPGSNHREVNYINYK